MPGGGGGGGAGGYVGRHPGAGPLPSARAGARPGVLRDEGGHAAAEPAKHGQGGRGEMLDRFICSMPCRSIIVLSFR